MMDLQTLLLSHAENIREGNFYIPQYDISISQSRVNIIQKLKPNRNMLRLLLGLINTLAGQVVHAGYTRHTTHVRNEVMQNTSHI